MTLTLPTGFEIQLLAPRSGERRRLAEEIAGRCGGSVHRVRLEDVEPALASGLGHVWHLTEAFTVHGREGARVCALLGEVATGPVGRSPSVLVTPPLASDHLAGLEAVLSPARELGFTVADEGAVHLHVDADPFRATHALANLVRLFGCWREPLHALLGTPPAQPGTGPLPSGLLDLVERPNDGWAGLLAAAAGIALPSDSDVDLSAVLRDPPAPGTIEVRLVPGTLDPSDVLRRAALLDGLLTRCLDPRPFPQQVSSDVSASAAELACSADSGMTAALPRARRSPRLSAVADSGAWSPLLPARDLEAAV